MNSRPFPIIGKYRFGWALFWISVLMLVFSLMIVMSDSIRNFPFRGMSSIGIIAVFTGWVFGGQQRKTTLSLICGLLSGFVLLALINSGGYRNLFQAYFEGIKSIRAALPYQPQDMHIQAMIVFLYRLIGDLVNFYSQFLDWMHNLFQGQVKINPIIIQTLWGSLVWSTSFTTGWLLRRKRHAFIASLPIVVLLTGILGYTRQNTTGLVIALSSLLMMIVLFEYLTLENKWGKEQIDFSEEIRFDIISLAIPTILVITIIAGILPNIPYEKIREIYNRHLFSQDNGSTQIDESLGLKITPPAQSLNNKPGSLPRAFMIGAGPELSENLVMEIDTGEAFLPREIDPMAAFPKYYWFGRSYDIYTGKGWATSDISFRNVKRNETIIPADLDTSLILLQKISKTSNAPATLYSIGIPQSVDHRVTVGWRNATGEYYSSQLDDLTYQVESPVLDISLESLQQADQKAPDIILENYLQINEEIPQRVTDLATSITQDARNDYEKAKAIETYLRQFEYTLDLPAPPGGRDIVDYFLFDLQKGYCDYYASAMVVMARAADLPARLAVGYSTGKYDPLKQVFVVTEANAHAWPEVYLAPYGWIPFEPTASLDTFNWKTYSDRPRETGENAPAQPAEVTDKPYLPDVLILVLVIFLFVAVLFVLNRIAKHKTSEIPTHQQIERIHQKTKKLLHRLFFQPKSAKTPLEFQHALVEWLNQQKTSRIDTWLIDKINKNLRLITELYQQGIYTPRPLSKIQITAAKQNLANLITHAWILYLVFLVKG